MSTSNRKRVLSVFRPRKRNVTWLLPSVSGVTTGLGGGGGGWTNIGGGGQPYFTDEEVRQQRVAGMYTDDEKSAVRCSHQNPEITQIYKEFLGEPMSHKSHELLHTKYHERPLYQK